MSDWKIKSVCSNCGYTVEDSPLSGDSWFTNQHFPVCPKCGKRDAFISKTIKEKFVRGDKWWKPGHWEIEDL